MNYVSFPGGDLIARSIADLERGGRSAPALLVAIGVPRLRELAIEVPAHLPATPERAPYDPIAETAGDGAHSQHNALVRRLVSSSERSRDLTRARARADHALGMRGGCAAMRSIASLNSGTSTPTR